MSIRYFAFVAAFITLQCWADTQHPIKSISLIPSKEPKVFTINSKSTGALFFPLVNQIDAAENRQRTTRFTKLLQNSGFKYSEALNFATSKALREEGFEIEYIQHTIPIAGITDSVDYEQIKFNGQIGLHISIDGIGFYAGYGNENYAPKFNVILVTFSKETPEYQEKTTIYYGAGAQRGREGSIAAPESSTVSNLEDLLSNASIANNIYSKAIDEISKLIAKKIKSASNSK